MGTAVLAALIAAFMLLTVAIYNNYMSIKINKRNSFVNTVTGERVKWLGKLRENLSDFSSRVYDLGQTMSGASLPMHSSQREEKLVELRKVQTMLRLQLNPNDPKDQGVISLIDEIFEIVERRATPLVNKKMEELISETQKMLKKEWERVKEEAQKETSFLEEIDKEIR